MIKILFVKLPPEQDKLRVADFAPTEMGLAATVIPLHVEPGVIPALQFEFPATRYSVGLVPVSVPMVAHEVMPTPPGFET